MKTISDKDSNQNESKCRDIITPCAWPVFVFLVCIFITLGCDQSFQPLKENEEYIFSIYGYLDASADTQWVRVSPAREEFEMPPELPDMQVTIEHLVSGQTVVMNDSLFSPGNETYYVNAWTTMDIQNGQSYRLKAERGDGATSQVTVSVPGSFPTPRVRRETHFIGEPDTYTIFIENAEKLAAVQTRWYVKLVAPGYEKKEVFTFSYRNDAEKLGDGRYRIPVQPDEDRQQMNSEVFLPDSGEIQVLHRQIFVAAGGPEWNKDISSLDDLIYALPGGFSNVENGLGYIVGIDSKLIPLESCRDDKELLIPCDEEESFW